MALSQAALAAAIKSEIEAQYGAADDAAMLTKFCNAIAKAVVDHITSSAVVQVTGVQTGPGTASGTVQ